VGLRTTCTVGFSAGYASGYLLNTNSGAVARCRPAVS
jgi:hypothetical protein